MDAPSNNVTAGFVAYASGRPALAETLETATKQISQSGMVDLITWQQLQIGGRLLLETICDEIAKRRLFIADVSSLNPNVLFELGFAIAKQRRIWILLDSTQDPPRANFDRFQLLTTIGYREFKNSEEIHRHFYADEPYASLDRTVYKDIIDSPPRTPHPKILYLKSEIETDASIKMSRRIARAALGATTDDPSEVRVQPLAWYARNVCSSLGVIAHLLSQDHKNAALHNGKLALVCGMAFGFGKPLLMLAHEPYTSPLDYRDLLKVHMTAIQCEQFTDHWLTQLESTHSAQLSIVGDFQQHAKARSELESVILGDPVAEQEVDDLPEYFVATATYNEALRARHSIVVGRKGTGKSAMLYKLADELSKDKRNHVCIIKPN